MLLLVIGVIGVISAGLAALYFAPFTIAQQTISVPYHAEAVIRDGRLTLREEIQLDQARFDKINAANGRDGAQRLTLTEATLSSGWASIGSRDGDPVYRQVRTFDVADPRTTATIQIPVGVNGVDGLGEIRFPTGPKDIWTMRPARDSTMEIRTRRRTIHATFPVYASITDNLAGEDVAVVPVDDKGRVAVTIFGPLVKNPIGRAAYPVYQDNLPLWVVWIVFLALGAMLNAKLQLAFEHGWAWVAVRIRRSRIRRRSRREKPAEGGVGPAELELPVARRRRERPAEHRFPNP